MGMRERMVFAEGEVWSVLAFLEAGPSFFFPFSFSFSFSYYFFVSAADEYEGYNKTYRCIVLGLPFAFSFLFLRCFILQ